MARNKTPRPANAQDYLGRVINFGYRLGFIPYKYDHEARKMLSDSSLKAKIIFGANIVAVLVYEGFICSTYYLTLQDPAAKAEAKVLGGYICIVSLLINVCPYITLTTYGKFHHVWNELMGNAAALKLETEELLVNSKEESKTYQAKMDKRNRMVILGGAISTGVPSLLRALKILRRPNTVGLISSAFEKPENLSLGAKLLFSLLQLNINGFHAFSLYFSGCIVITYVCSVLPILQDTVLGKLDGSSWKLANMGRTIGKVSTSLKVFQACFNSTYKLWPLATQVICSIAVISRLLLAVKLGAVHHFAAGIVMLVTLLSFFIGFAEIHEKSDEAQKSWRSLREPRWFPKYVRSFRCMRVSVGGFYYADKSLVLTIMAIIIDNTTNLVLTTGDFGHE